MKVITETILRQELTSDEITTYTLPEGKILSPAAREYLQQRKIKLVNPTAPKAPLHTAVQALAAEKTSGEYKFVDYATGAYYQEKPEHMTHLHHNVLVPKNHPRIVFRGKLDSLEALIVLAQATLTSEGKSEALVADLGDVMRVVTQIMRSDVLGVPLEIQTILGFTKEELHARSHNPKKYYNIPPLLLPNYTMGKEYALINQIRTAVREVEVCCVDAFFENGSYTKNDITLELNRLSSCMHLIGCKFLAGEYK